MQTLQRKVVCMALHLKLYGFDVENAPTEQVETLIRAGAEAIQELLNNPNLHCLELY